MLKASSFITEVVISILELRIRPYLQELPGRHKTLIHQHAIMPFCVLVYHLNCYESKGMGKNTGNFENKVNRGRIYKNIYSFYEKVEQIRVRERRLEYKEGGC